MTLELPELEYGYHELEPFISRQTLELHHKKHHETYLKNVRDLVRSGPLANASLGAIIRNSMGDAAHWALFNNAAQAWNHAFYWRSMRPDCAPPSGEFADQIEHDFGGLDRLIDEMKYNAACLFGSGWVWLVMEDCCLRVTSTANATLPYCYGQVPLLTIDVWEHAYYLDFQNCCSEYVDSFFGNLVNWAFAQENFDQCEEQLVSAAQ